MRRNDGSVFERAHRDDVRGHGTPLAYSIHTDIAQLDGINMAPWSAAILQSTTSAMAQATVTTSPSFKRLMESRGIRRIKDHYRPLPVSGVVAAADALSDAEVAAVRNELTAGHPTRPVMTYVGRWSAEKRMHLLKRCRPRGATLAFVGDGPMRDAVMEWHDPPRCVVLPGMRPRTALAGDGPDWCAGQCRKPSARSRGGALRHPRLLQTRRFEDQRRDERALQFLDGSERLRYGNCCSALHARGRAGG